MSACAEVKPERAGRAAGGREMTGG